MLARMGWEEGSALGADGTQGLVTPLSAGEAKDRDQQRRGVGAASTVSPTSPAATAVEDDAFVRFRRDQSASRRAHYTKKNAE